MEYGSTLTTFWYIQIFRHDRWGCQDNLRGASPIACRRSVSERKECEFLTEEISFLGHVISASGIKTDPEKTRGNHYVSHPHQSEMTSGSARVILILPKVRTKLLGNRASFD